MPIARLPGSTSNTLTDATVTAGEALSAGEAVAVVFDGGFPRALLAGAALADNARSFAGFAVGDYVLGQVPSITVARGSLVTPVVEGGGALTPNSPVFLSETPGQVTQTPPTSANTLVLPVGIATTAARMLLTTDFKARNN